nr:uncharacterized protein LOC111415432 [Onthophagus taurus]
MKSFLVVFLVVIAAAFADEKEFVAEFKALIKDVGTKCLSEVGATNDDLDSLIMKKEIPTKHEGMCLILCMHKHWGIQTADGKMDLEAGLKSIAPLKEFDADAYSKATTVFKTCHEKVKEDSDPCVTATHMAKCGKEESEKLGLHENYDI